MNADFQYDVFLSHSAKDKAVMRPLAERLECAFGPRFSDFGLSRPLRLGDATIKGSLAQFLCSKWRPPTVGPNN